MAVATSLSRGFDQVPQMLSLVKHLKGKQHKRAADLQTKSEMGAEVYQQNIVNVALIF